ncbi:MAG: response regulator [Acidobacteriia bacterium]|nr:response regulator [Terriglobia bacterium]
MPRTILIVDDSPSELKLMQLALEGSGCQILTAADGEQALEQAEQHRPDLIVLDVILPKKNGFQVCRQIKTAPGTKDIKVILVTSKTQDSDRYWGLKQGADEYLTKPYQPKDLLASVKRHLYQ